RRLLEAGLGGCRLTWIGSVDGGLEELDEFRLSRASRAAIRRSNESTRLRMAALTSAGILTQRSSGRGGLALMPSDVTERDQWRKSLLTVKAYPKSGVRSRSRPSNPWQQANWSSSLHFSNSQPSRNGLCRLLNHTMSESAGHSPVHAVVGEGAGSLVPPVALMAGSLVPFWSNGPGTPAGGG